MSDEIQMLQNRVKISDVVLRFAHAMDTQDWTLLRACLTNEVDIDYSDLRGDPPHVVLADDFVAARKKGLSGLRTQHLSTNHLITITGDMAECVSAFLIHRINPMLPTNENRFDTAGHYIHGLQCSAEDNRWRIYRIKQTVVWNIGNRQVHGAFR